MSYGGAIQNVSSNEGENLSMGERVVGRICAIFIFPEPGGLARSVLEVNGITGVGLEGDHHRNPHRAVTLLSVQAWEETRNALATNLPPEMRRSNILVDEERTQLPLAQAIGMRLVMGEVELLVRGETTPCQRMDELRVGLRKVLSARLRGGVYGPVVTGGVMRVGHVVRARNSTAESQLQMQSRPSRMRSVVSPRDGQ